ncbi:hypothetical protein M569_13131, partial [Genlisea aurea]
EVQMAPGKTGGDGLPPHVLIFPLPLQGPVNAMLKLSELLCLAGIHVTFLLSNFSYALLRRHSDIESRFSRYSGFRIAGIDDGLPEDRPRVGVGSIDLLSSILRVGETELRKVLEATDSLRDGSARRRVSFIIIDGILNFVLPVAEELGIPVVHFRTISACSFWASFCSKEVIAAGELPLRGEEEGKYEYWRNPNLDLPVTSIPGMEAILRRRDLPSFFRVTDPNDSELQMLATDTRKAALSAGLILNTFEDLEGPIIDEIRKRIPNVYSIGPLHTHLKSHLDPRSSSVASSSSFLREDRTSIDWLNSQPPKSVIYVSFGSLTQLTEEEHLEFLNGLVNSGHRFLWVVRPDSIAGSDKVAIPEELEQGTRERGYVVEWAPQMEVLAHPSVGAFFTHGGWNSTLESICAGVPMICWPYFIDQPTNSRFVSHEWKVGLDVNSCDRVVVEEMVREVMEDRRRDELSER